jgi:cell division protein FtsQ
LTRKNPHTKHVKKAAVPLNVMSWIAAVFFIAGLAVIAGFYLEQNTRIAAVDFSGNFFTADAGLLDQLEPVSPVGEMADSVNYRTVFEALHSLPYVKSLNVSMNYRGRLTFNVSEHEPIGLIVDGSNRKYVAEGGILLPVVPGKARDVPLVYGFPAAAAVDSLTGKKWDRMEEFLTEARKSSVSWVTLSEVAWNDREGVVALSHENGVKLVFGHEDYSDRLSHWELFYTDVVTRQGIDAFSRIDLRFRNQIVTQQS